MQNSQQQYHLSEGPTLTLERVDRNHAGMYQCMADNSVREPAYADLELTVLCEYFYQNLNFGDFFWRHFYLIKC